MSSRRHDQAAVDGHRPPGRMGEDEPDPGQPEHRHDVFEVVPARPGRIQTTEPWAGLPAELDAESGSLTRP
jgi:hypothetical protein